MVDGAGFKMIMFSDQVQRAVDGHLRANAEDAAQYAVDELKKTLSSSKSRNAEERKDKNVYARGKTAKGKARVHYSSRPGEPPAVDTGNLRNAQMYEVKQEGAQLIARVGPSRDANYGKFSEFGTGTRGKAAAVDKPADYVYGSKPGMAPRPWFMVTMERIKDEIARRIARPMRG